MVASVINAKSFSFNLSNYLVEAESKKKKIKFPGHSEGEEPENHEASAKGIAAVIWKALPSLGWGRRRGSRAFWQVVPSRGMWKNLKAK